MRTYAAAPPFAFAVALGVALLGAHPAQGKPAAAAPARIDAKATKALLRKLGSGDASVVLDGLAGATAAGANGAATAPAIEAILSRGSTGPITRAAIEALGAIGASSSSAAIRPYLRHRVAEIRRAAARALAWTRGPEAIAAYKEGLRSGDAEVRAVSASGLGRLGAREALPELFLALDHNVNEAAAAIGQVCVDDECSMLIAKLGKLPLEVMTSGLDAIVFRSSPLPEQALVKRIGEIRALGTPEAAKYLADALGRWPASGSSRVKRSLEGGP